MEKFGVLEPYLFCSSEIARPPHDLSTTAMMFISTLDVELTITSGQQIQTHHHVTPNVKKLRFHVAARIGHQCYQTKTVAVSKKSYPTWGEKHNFTVSKGNSLILELFCAHKHRKTHIVGSSQTDILSLHPLQVHDIKIYNRKDIECGIISVRFDIPVSSPVEQNRFLAHPLRLSLVTHVINHIPVQKIPPRWADLLVSLYSIAELVKVVAQLHPIARLVVNSVSLALEIAVRLNERNKKVEDLMDTMAVIYRLILDAEPLKIIESCEATLGRLLAKTNECLLFVAEYYKPRSPMMKAIMLHDDILIASFEKAFAALRMEFVSNTSLHGVLSTLRILENVENVAKDVYDVSAAINLPVHGKGWNAQNVCFPGSLKGVLDDVARWVVCQQPEAPVYLLVGPPGCGKTCVANSTAAMFEYGKRLGASIFLDKGHQDPSKIFTSIARELVAFDEKLKICISRAISKQPRLPTDDPERQLFGLIIEPLNAVTIIGPILVVIDGLDRCESRDRILAAFKNARNIPGNLRILITARPEADIEDHLTGLPHCHIHQMKADGEGIVHNVPEYSRQCLNLLQDARPSIFDDISLGEALTEFEAKSCGVFLWHSVAIRFLSIASDDTARAFLTVVSSATTPPDHSTAMLNLKHAIFQALSATSPVRLKLDLSIGGATALGVSGLRSDKTANVLEKMVAQQLVKYDDVADQYLSTIPHPGSSYARRNVDDQACSHTNIQDDHDLNTCMAHVCIDFLDIRLTADICVRSCRSRKNGERVINPRLVKALPGHLRPYIKEAYHYAARFWMAHLEDVQSCCAIDSLRYKLLHFPKHFFHLLKLERERQRPDDILQRLFTAIEHSQLNNPSFRSQFRDLLNRVKEYFQAHRDQSPEGWGPVIDEFHTVCDCPRYAAWGISSRSMCSFKIDIEYKGGASAGPWCLKITPPVLPLADGDGQVCRAVEEVELVVDRTAEDDIYQRLPPDMQIGVAIIRPHSGALPTWARQLPSPFPEPGGVDDYAAKEPWLIPLAGGISSTVFRWVDDKLQLEMDRQLRCLLQLGDRLGIIAHFNSQCEGVSFRIQVTLNVKYALNDEEA